MTHKEILACVDHTLLRQTAVWEDIKNLCDKAAFYHTASVCIPPCYVKKAKEYLNGKMKVCTVVGFPNGYHTTEAKIFESRDALKNGADELDMVINIGAIKADNDDYVKREIQEIKKIAGSHILKVIAETCFLTEKEKIRLCHIVTDAGADYIKTSTGFAEKGAAFQDVELFKENIGSGIRIKAAGGIHSFEDAEKFLMLGADRLGTSSLVKIENEK